MNKLIILLIVAVFIGSSQNIKAQANETKKVKSELKSNNNQTDSTILKNGKINTVGISAPDKNIKTEPLPKDFPKFINTGNPSKDKNNFHIAKQKWIKDNPEKFEKIKGLNIKQ